ncbi:SpoIIE family protein phosphatase [Nocardiopsis metallicus]|uniref:Anti-sigma regulatory factor (Ser/Thr protein kinase) n=1 Tax=Nocardiopsis metallicus TaxID=179819 RepID=A0A840WRP4_9ACTN|nr:SpoIIE family protein phosphatase [Nocardiopsis metallicus]MBB5492798.1 anti-sigma regulatory factor (Ser/Thr protein kinase) [Nocardiopsis metallicus]
MTRVWDVSVGDSTLVRRAREAVEEAAVAAGLNPARAGDAALTATELATNAVKYAGGGRIVAEVARDDWGNARALQILALDHGPGILDVDRAMADGYSTGGSLGSGLGACARACDHFEVDSVPGRGTLALARIAAPEHRGRFSGPAVTGGLHLPLGGHPESGDGLAFRSGSGHRTVMLADGLGHGAAAAEASDAAAGTVRRQAGEPPEALLRLLHAELRSTRGAAVAVVDIDESAHRLTFCGVGNVGARLHSNGRWETLLSQPGIVGAFGLRTPVPQRRAWNRGDMLVLHTDGLPSRWSPEGIEGMVTRDAALIAGRVFRDAGSAARPLRDDTAVAVALHTERFDGKRA